MHVYFFLSNYTEKTPLVPLTQYYIGECKWDACWNLVSACGSSRNNFYGLHLFAYLMENKRRAKTKPQSSSTARARHNKVSSRAQNPFVRSRKRRWAKSDTDVQCTGQKRCCTNTETFHFIYFFSAAVAPENQQRKGPHLPWKWKERQKKNSRCTKYSRLFRGIIMTVQPGVYS